MASKADWVVLGVAAWMLLGGITVRAYGDKAQRECGREPSFTQMLVATVAWPAVIAVLDEPFKCVRKKEQVDGD